MKPVMKSVKRTVGVELNLDEFLEMLDGWEFTIDTDDRDTYCFSYEDDDISASVAGKKVPLDKIKVKMQDGGADRD